MDAATRGRFSPFLTRCISGSCVAAVWCILALDLFLKLVLVDNLGNVDSVVNIHSVIYFTIVLDSL